MRKKSLIFLSLIAYVLLIISVIKVKTYKYDNSIYTLNEKSINFLIDATSSVVLNANTMEILYQNNSHSKLLPASITKILTCITALETYQLDDYVYITSEMIDTIGSKIYLMPGDYVKIEDLLLGLMLNSGNDAAKVLAMNLSGNEKDFIALMNKLARKIGMKNSIFNNSSGLDNDTVNYTTAYDMAILTAYAIKNREFRRIFGTKSKVVELENHFLYLHHKHKLVQHYDYVVGGKTGYTERAGRTLVTVYNKNGTDLIVVTLDAHNDWQIHQNFYNYFLNEKKESTKLLVNYSIKPLSERLRGKIDD